MMIEFKLIQLADQIGCEMMPEGENIRVMNIDSLPSLLKVKIIEHKTQILEILKRDNQAKKIGFIIGLPGQIYFRSINKKASYTWRSMTEIGSYGWKHTMRTGLQVLK
jgi:hypothetical protein